MPASTSPPSDDDRATRVVPDDIDDFHQPKSPLHGRAFASWEELASQPLPEREWVIDKLIPCGLVSIIVGESGIGKSMLVLDMMHCIAQGEAWAKQYACPARTVALLDLEGDFLTLRRRITQLNSHRGGVAAEAARRMFFLSDQGALDICERATEKHLIQQIRAQSIDVLFIDTLICTHLVDENGSEMKSVMDAFERIARASNATIVLLHHTGKPRQGQKLSARGHSSIKGAVQHELTLKRDKSNHILISLTKAKSGPLIDFVASIELKPTDDEGLILLYTEGKDGKSMPGRPSENGDRHEVVLTLLRERPRKYSELVTELMSQSTCSKSTAKTTIREMKLAGTIQAEGDLYMVNQAEE